MSMERYKPAEGEIGELIMVEETKMFKDYCLFNTNETTVVLTWLWSFKPLSALQDSFTFFYSETQMQYMCLFSDTFSIYHNNLP